MKHNEIEKYILKMRNMAAQICLNEAKKWNNFDEDCTESRALIKCACKISDLSLSCVKDSFTVERIKDAER